MRQDQIDRNIEVKNKLTLDFENSTVIQTTIENALSLNIDECIVVLGHYASQIKEAINDNIKDKIKFVVNKPVDVGLSMSLLNGLTNTKSEYALCITGDQPTVTAQTFENIIGALEKSPNPDRTISVLRRLETGKLDTAEGLGMPFAANRENLIDYLKNENDNLNPILRKMFNDGYDFYGVKELNRSELININHHDDYLKCSNKKKK